MSLDGHYSAGCYCVECRKLRGDDKMPEVQQDFKDAIKEVKRCVRILVELDSTEAAAAISVKLIDALDAVALSDFGKSADDVWACCFVVQRILYDSLTIKIGKNVEMPKWSTNREGYKAYLDATITITKGTGYEALFIGRN